MVLAAAPEVAAPALPARPEYLLVLSARDRVQLRQRVADLLQHLTSQEPLPLADLAVTLATKRSHLAVRAAWVASSWDEQLANLRQIHQALLVITPRAIAPEATPAQSWLITPSDDPILTPDGAMGDTQRAQVAQLLQSGRSDRPFLLSLAADFVAGTLSDLTALYPEPGRLVDLPRYPFDRTRYWVQRSPQLTPPPLSPAPARDLTFWMSQHHVQGTAVLPGAAILQQMLEAGQAAGHPIGELRDIGWLHPVQTGMALVPQWQTQDSRLLLQLQARVEPDPSGATASLDRPCATAVWISTPSARSSSETPNFDPVAVQRRCGSTWTQKAFYDLVDGRDVVHGPLYRTVEQLWAGPFEALGKLKAPASELAWLPRMALHPSLLDGALQCVMGLLAPRAADLPLLLPASIATLQILQPLTEDCWVYVRPSQAPISEYSFDLRITNLAGEDLIRINTFTLRPLRTEGSLLGTSPNGHPGIPPLVPGGNGQGLSRSGLPVGAGPVPAHNGAPVALGSEGAIAPTGFSAAAPASAVEAVPCYRPVWQETPWPEPIAPESGAVLMVYAPGDRPLAAALQAQHPSAPIYQVQLAGSRQFLGSNHWQVGAAAGDWEPIWPQLPPLETIYFLAAGSRSAPASLAELTALQDQGVVSLFHLIQGLDRHRLWRSGARLRVITQEAQAVGVGPIQPWQATVIGFTKALSREFTDLAVTCLDLSRVDLELVEPIDRLDLTDLTNPFAHLARRIATEPAAEPGLELAYRGTRRLRRAIQPMALPPDPRPLPIDPDGCYLIVGGMTGIGYEAAKCLAAITGVKLILTGRRPLTEVRAAQLRELTDLGAIAQYRAVDVADPVAMAGLIQEIQQTWGPLRGVIHSALVLQDASLRTMTPAALQAALAPKVAGSWLLVELTRQQPLDFLIFFSSANALMGNAGQSNYAAGCTFQDAFALALPPTGPRIQIINWGYWRETGIVATEFYSRRIEKQGILGINTAEGVETLERLLRWEVRQCLPMLVAPEILDQLQLTGWTTEPAGAIASPMLPAAAAQAMARFVQERPIAPESIEAFQQLEAYAHGQLLATLRQLGVLRSAADRWSVRSVMTQLAVQPRYERLIWALGDLLTRAGFLAEQGDGLGLTPLCLTPEMDRRIANSPAEADRLRSRYVGIDPCLTLLDRCLERYGDILRGACDPLEILFPRGSAAQVEGIYRGNPLMDYYNDLTAATVAAAVVAAQPTPQQPFRILEIGGGTGGTSFAVLKALDAYAASVHYTFTDISPTLVYQAQQTLDQGRSFCEFRVLNIAQDVAAQSFAPGSYDLVLAANVLHATESVTASVREAKRLLKRHGLLVLNEGTRVQDFATLTFGLTEGWWLFGDGDWRLPHAPLLSPAQWEALFRAAGFQSIHLASPARPDAGFPIETIILGASDGWMECPTAAAPQGAPVVPDRPVAPSAPSATPSSAAPTLAEGDSRAVVLAHLRQVFGQVLRLEGTTLSRQANFETYGVDSLVTLELIRALEQTFGLLPQTLLFQCPSLDALTQWLEANKSEAITALVAVARSAVPSAVAAPASSGELSPPSPGLPPAPVPAPLPSPLTSAPRSTTSASTTSLIPTTPAPELAGGGQPLAEPIAPVPTGRSSQGPSPARSIAPTSRAVEDGAIAIVGLAGRYPGGADLAAFWETLITGRDVISEPPSGRQFESPEFELAEHPTARRAGWLGAIDTFDPRFFGISPVEATGIDPQERLFMEVAWAALEDAGLTPNTLVRSPDPAAKRAVGVFAGVMYGEYQLLAAEAALQGDFVLTGASPSSIANRLSYFCNFQGPSLAVDTACSSSLVAIHLAVQSLRRGECRAALAGGVNLILHPRHLLALHRLKMLANDGVCRPFGAGASGMVPGEGVGVVVLKPLADAERDGDRIWGVIRGSAVNSGGKVSGYTVPNPTAQAAVIRSALQDAMVDPHSLSYIEAHGTGTTLGDPIEVAGLTEALGAHDQPYCAIGSLKANIGHLEAAAGIAGLTKVLLQMRHGQLAPSLYAADPNPHIAFDQAPVRVQTQAMPWQARPGVPRRAGISSFGAGGVNAHLIVEEYRSESGRSGLDPDPARAQTPWDRPGIDRNGSSAGDLHPGGTERNGFDRLVLDPAAAPATAGELMVSEGEYVVPVSALDRERLQVWVRQLRSVLIQPQNSPQSDPNPAPGILATEAPIDWVALVWTLQTGRVALPYRLAVVAKNLNDLLSQWEAFLADGPIAQGLVGRCGPDDQVIRTRPDSPMALATAWVQGAEVDWEALWLGPKPSRVTLPSYPFELRPCWFPRPAQPVTVAINTGRAELLPASSPASSPDLPSAKKPPSSPGAVGGLIPDWQAIAPEAASGAAVDPVVGEVLLWIGPEAEGATMAAAVQAHPDCCRFRRVIQVIPGLAFEPLPGDRYRLNSSRESDFGELLAHLAGQGLAPTHVLFRSLATAAPGDAPPQAIRQGLTQTLYPLFYGLRALLRSPAISPSPVSWIYLGEDPAAPWTAAAAFCTAVGQESTRLRPAVLSGVTELNQPSRELLRAIALLWQRPELNHLQFQATGSRVRTWQLLDPAIEPGNPAPSGLWQGGGCYILTGGLGAIGQQLVENAIGSAPVSLVLVGRSPLDDRKTARLEAWRAQGAQITYVAADVGDWDGAIAVVNAARQTGRPLRGVIHAAGLIEDALLIHKDRPTFGRVLRPKVQGTVYLDYLTRQDPLDFFLCLSSLSALMGAPGQGDYAAANAFLDAWIQQRETQRQLQQRSGVSRTLNLPFWQGGGMALTEVSQAWMADMAGLQPLTPAQGLELIHWAIRQPHPQVAIAPGEPEKFQAFLQGRFQGHSATPAQSDRPLAANPMPAAPVAAQATASDTLPVLRSIISDLLGLRPEEIDPQARLGELGFDSLQLARLGEAIQKQPSDRVFNSALLFENPTVATLTPYLRSDQPANPPAPAPQPIGSPVSPLGLTAVPGGQSPGAEAPTGEPTFAPSMSDRPGELAQITRSRRFNPQEPIAIIGMAGRFPGSNTLEDFWDNLAAGADCITEVPASRWNPDQYASQCVCRWGAFWMGLINLIPCFSGFPPGKRFPWIPKSGCFCKPPGTPWKMRATPPIACVKRPMAPRVGWAFLWASPGAVISCSRPKNGCGVTKFSDPHPIGPWPTGCPGF